MRFAAQRLLSFLAVLAVSFGFASAALAGDIVPPEVLMTTPTGINIADGTYTYKRTDLSIGTLTLERFYLFYPITLRDPDTMFYGPHTSNNFDIFVAPVFAAPRPPTFRAAEYKPIVHFGSGASGMYVQPDFSNYPQLSDDSGEAAQGALGYVNGAYTYTDQTGAVYTFNPSVLAAGVGNSGSPVDAAHAQRIASIAYPDGRVRSFSYNSSSQLKMVSDSTGYAIIFDYGSNGFVATACGFALAQTTVTVNSTCSGATLKVMYGYTGSNLTSVTDVLGRVETYGYGGYGNAVSCITPPGYTTCKINNNYTDQGDVTQTLADGAKWQLGWSYVDPNDTDFIPYDGDSPATVVDPMGKTWNYVFTATSPVSATDPDNNTTNYHFTGGIDWEAVNPPTTLGSILSEYDWPEGRKYLAQYFGPYGTPSTETWKAKTTSGLSDIVIQYGYTCPNVSSPSCAKPTSKIDARGNETDYIYDPVHGGVLTETGPAAPNGVRPQTRYTYQQIPTSGVGGAQIGLVWRVTQASTCMTGSAPACVGTADEIRTTTSYAGSTSALPTSVTVTRGDGSPLSNGNATSAVTTTAYDSSGNPISVIDPLGQTTNYVYDAMRRRIGEIGPDPDGSGPLLPRATRTVYTPNGLVGEVDKGTVASPTNDPTVFNQTFAILQSVVNSYDNNDRKIQEVQIGGGTTYAVTQYSYDAADHLLCTAVRMNPGAFSSLPSGPTAACTLGTAGSYGPDRITYNYYDDVGHLKKVTTGYGTSVQRDEKTIVASANITTAFTGDGLPAAVKDGDGNVSTYMYDGFDRISQLQYPSPTTIGSSSTTDYEGFSYDANANVTSHRLRDATSIGFTYDALNRKTTKTPPEAANAVSYGYDNLGHLTAESFPNNSSLNMGFTYDALGRKVQETGPLGDVGTAWDLAGRRTQLTWPDSFYVAYTYDNDGELTNVEENGATSGLGLMASFIYDNLGNRTGIARANGVSTAYGFDAISRLTSLAHTGSSSNQSYAFTYDPAHEIVSKTTTNGAYAWNAAAALSQAYQLNGQNQYVSVGSTAFAYDLRGNLAVGPETYTYDSENRLTYATAPATTLSYYPDGALYQTAGSATTRFLYDDDQIIAEYDGSNNLLRRYVEGPAIDETLVWYEGSGTSDRRWLLDDYQGSVIAGTNPSGTVLFINSYDEYGQPGSSNAGRFQYTGQAWIPEASLYDYRARDYMPGIGRFLQTDPKGYDAGMNLYDYAEDDPVDHSDPTGQNTAGQETSEGGCTGHITGGCGGDHFIIIPVNPAEEEQQLAANDRTSGGRVDPEGKGPAGEGAAGIKGQKMRIPSRTGTAKYRVPDESSVKHIREVKNVQRLRITNQIKDFVMEGKATLRDFFLSFDKDTYVSPNVQVYLDRNGVIVQKLPMNGQGSEGRVAPGEPVGPEEPIIIEP